MDHEVKVKPADYKRLASGEMTFQVLQNDNYFQQGEFITFREWDDTRITTTDPAPKGFTDSKPLVYKAGFILPLSKSEVVISLLPVKKQK